MSRFAFEAFDRNGTLLRGTIEASDQAGVIDQLLLEGRTPVSIKAIIGKNTLLAGVLETVGRSRFEYVDFLHELAILLGAGLPVERALLVLKGLARNAPSSLRIQQIIDSIRSGNPLSQSFAAVLTEAPPYIARLLAAGEASGRLAEITEQTATGLVKLRQLKSRLISDLSYPVILLLAIAIVLWIIFHVVLPRLAPMFEQSGAQLPVETELLLGLGRFFDGFGGLLLLAGAGAAVIFWHALKRQSTRLNIHRYWLTTRLLFGVPREYEAARFCRTLQTLLEGGLTLERALSVTSESCSNQWLRTELNKVQGAVSEGARLSQSLLLLAPSLSLIVSEFSAVGEETGRLAAMMHEAADILEHSTQTKLDRLTTLVVPITTVVMGAVVASLMAGIVSGILAINDVAK